MGMPPDGSAAPPFMGRTPPDRVQMSLEQHCDGLLACIARNQPTPEQMQYLSSTFQQAEQMLTAYQTGQPVGAPPQTPGAQGVDEPGAEQAPDTTQNFGEDPNSVPYGDDQ